MAATISVNKQNVIDLLGSGIEKPFVIPEYQRPYMWTDEQIQTLFDDLWEFATTIGGMERKGTYFLGSIVSFENENGEKSSMVNNVSLRYSCYCGQYTQNCPQEMKQTQELPSILGD